MNLHIKNMVCDRCLMVVRNQLEELGLPFKNVQLGQVELSEEPKPGKLELLRQRLSELGFELLDDKKSKTVERIKNTIISLVHGKDVEDYHYLTTLFSTVEGITIEKYAILQRIEKVKELLMYDEKSLSEIAYEMGYSSVQHLSQQFKKVTGLTPTQFKSLRENNRKPLDKI
jgi:AraC family transcriptional regulator